MHAKRSARRSARAHPQRADAQKPKVSTPGSQLRARVLDVLKNEGFIRGYAAVEQRTAAVNSRSS